MRLATVIVAGLIVCMLPLSGVGGVATTEESAIEELHKAQADLDKANSQLHAIESAMRAIVVDREETPKQGNLRGRASIARGAATDPSVADEIEAIEAEAEAWKAIAKNEFEEAESSMAKFFELKELRATRMREQSAVLDEQLAEDADTGA